MGKTAFRKHTLTYDDGVTLVVRASTLRSDLEQQALAARLDGKIELGAEYLFSYIPIVGQTLEAIGIGFTLPDMSADDADHVAAFAQFIDLPGGLIADWFEACQRVNVPEGSVPELQPGAASDDPKPEANAPSS